MTRLAGAGRETKRHPPSAAMEREGVIAVEQVVVRDLGWIFRDQPVSDYGIDGHVEIVNDGEPTGRLLAVQIKSGESWFSMPTNGGWWFRPSEAHVRYWRSHSLPIIIVLYDPAIRRSYWQIFSDRTVEHAGHGWKILIPDDQVVSNESCHAWALAANILLPAEVGRPSTVESARNLRKIIVLACLVELARPTQWSDEATFLMRQAVDVSLRTGGAEGHLSYRRDGETSSLLVFADPRLSDAVLVANLMRSLDRAVDEIQASSSSPCPQLRLLSHTGIARHEGAGYDGRAFAALHTCAESMGVRDALAGDNDANVIVMMSGEVYEPKVFASATDDRMHRWLTFVNMPDDGTPLRLWIRAPVRG